MLNDGIEIKKIYKLKKKKRNDGIEINKKIDKKIKQYFSEW